MPTGGARRQILGVTASSSIIGPEVHTDKALDRGHLGRRVDAVCGPHPGRTREPPSQNSIGYRWRTTPRSAELTGVKLHDLRHFHASGLIASGCDVVTVQRALGHATATTTLNTPSATRARWQGHSCEARGGRGLIGLVSRAVSHHDHLQWDYRGESRASNSVGLNRHRIRVRWPGPRRRAPDHRAERGTPAHRSRCWPPRPPLRRRPRPPPAADRRTQRACRPARLPPGPADPAPGRSPPPAAPRDRRPRRDTR